MARILIVDDSPTETYRFKEILERHGHKVLEASNGADGVAVARAELPDLVLMDVVFISVSSKFGFFKHLSHISLTIFPKIDFFRQIVFKRTENWLNSRVYAV